jgi:hypothetical protein
VACLWQWARRRVHERYEVEEGWEYPFRLSWERYRKWGKHPESYICRPEGTDYSY